MRISHQKMPYGGWKYYESRTNITLVGYDFEKLVEHMKHHRKSNGLPEGDPATELEEYTAKQHPELVIT